MAANWSRPCGWSSVVTVTPDLPRPVDLSVVVGTAHPSEELDRLLDRLLPQLSGIRGEFVLVDGSPDGLPTPEYAGVAITHLRQPHTDVFGLRAIGAKHAAGWVVAFTEDHCTPVHDDWCEQILAGHVRHGQQAALTGATTNGTPGTLWNRANFLVTFAPVMPPLAVGTALHRVPPPANISIKSEVLSGYALTGGFLEFELMPHLTAVGHVAVSNEVLVAHNQSNSAGWFLRHHFHNGRTTGGLLRRRCSGWSTSTRRVLTTLALVPRHLRQTWHEVGQRPGERRAALPALPAAALLLTAHAAGELVGMLAGAGRSPHELA